MEAEKQIQPPPQQEQGPALFFCHLCQSEYRQPKLLKCLHSFCTPCLTDKVTRESSGNASIICPLCSYATPVPVGGVRELTDNQFLQRVSSEYVQGVKHNIVAKSLSPQTIRRAGGSYSASYLAGGGSSTSSSSSSSSGVGVGVRSSRFVGADEAANNRMANLTDEQKTVSSRNQHYESADAPAAPSITTEVTPTVISYSEMRRNSLDRGQYTVTSKEAVTNMSRLEGKMMSLQGEALRVTYAIDRINHQATNWHQHKEDMKQEVQRRSHQFQVAARKLERQIVSEIESKTTEDRFYDELDRGKTILRGNLKNILHEISVIKSVHELGRYSEINDLSTSLLCPSIGISDVTLDMLNYQLDIPTKSIDEMVSVGFGNLITNQEGSSVYVPELRNFIDIPLSEIPPEQSPLPDFEISKGEEIVAETSTVAESTRGRSTMSRRQLAKAAGSKRYTSDIGPTDVLENVEQFQSARESLRTRRQEILRQGQFAREDVSPMRGEARKLTWPNFNRGRVQSLDRSSGRDERSLLSENDQLQGNYANRRNGDKVKRPDDLSMPSPIIEEASSPESPPKKPGTDDRIPGRFMPQTLSPSAESNVLLGGRQKKISLGSSSPQSSLEGTPPQSPTYENRSIGERTLRRAIINTGDKRSKMEFLRENWQKRKEILIQSQGFVSSESNAAAGKTKIDPAELSPDATSALDQNDTSANLVSKSQVLPSRPVIEKFQEKVSSYPPQATSQTTVSFVKSKDLVDSQTARRKFTFTNDKAGMDDDDDEEEHVETSTITIPVTSQLLKQMRTETNDFQTDKTKVEGEEEVSTTTTETFSIQKDKTSVENSRGAETNSYLATRLTTSRPEAIKSTIRSSTESMERTMPSSSSLQTSISRESTAVASSRTVLNTNPYISTRYSKPVTNETAISKETPSSQLPAPFSSSRLDTKVPQLASQSNTTAITTAISTTASPSSTASTTTSTSSSVVSTSATQSTATSSSFVGKYSKRHVPRTETIDVAALLANMYKPAPTAAQKDEEKKKEAEKKKNDEEKENMRQGVDNIKDTRVKDQRDSKTLIESDRATNSHSSSPNNSISPSMPLKSTYTKQDGVEIYKIPRDSQTQQITETSSYVAYKKETTPVVTDINNSRSNNRTNSETGSREQQESTHTPHSPSGGSPRDQRVDETFNQVETSRKRYSPSHSRSSGRTSRRHTVDISKTIPAGVRISDMYKPEAVTEATDATRGMTSSAGGGSRAYGQPQADLHTTVIEESQEEYAKDSTTSITETFTLPSHPGASTTGSAFSSSSRLGGGLDGRYQPEVVENAAWDVQSTQSAASDESQSAAIEPYQQLPLTSDQGPGHGRLRDIARKKKERWRRLTIS